MFEDNDLILASVSDPRFKTSWLTSSAAVKHAEKLLKEAFRKERENANQSDSELYVVLPTLIY